MSRKASSVILERRFVPEGTLIVEEGDEGQSAYLIQLGAVEVFTEHEERSVVLARLDKGQIFGEMALVFDEKRTASVRAVEDCNLIVISRQAFQQKLRQTDPTIKAMIQMLTQRIVSANNAVITKKSDMHDLLDTTRLIYQNVLGALPKNRQRTFQNAVLPKLDDFLNAVRSFEDRYDQ